MRGLLGALPPKLRATTARARRSPRKALGPLEVRGTDCAGRRLPVSACLPIRALAACRGAVPFFAAALREVPFVLGAAFGTRERARRAVLPGSAPVLSVPSDAFVTAVPFGGCGECRLSEDLHARLVELPGMFLTVLLRGQQHEVRRVVVERVMVLVVYVHSARYRPVHVGEDVAVQVPAPAASGRLVVHALGPVVAARVPLVRNAPIRNLNWWIHQVILSVSDALLLAFYSGARTRVRWL